jgi:hypothetical protein
MPLEWKEDITLQLARPTGTDFRQVALSSDGRYLAVAFGNGADIWDTADGLRASQATYQLRGSTPITSMKWFPSYPCLICTHGGSRVYIATFTPNGFSSVGLCRFRGHDAAKMAAVLNERLIAIGYNHSVEIRQGILGM